MRPRGLFLLHSVFSLWAWLATGLAACVGFAVQLALCPLVPLVDRRRLAVGRTFRLAAVAASTLNPLWRFRVHGPITRPGPRTVCISNHCSQSDAFLISHLPWEMKWLGKRSLFRIPIVGWSMWLAGDVPVDRSSKDSGRRALERCARWIERGVPIMFFPEGTRSGDGELLPFRDGAFRLAVATGADLLPLAVAGTRQALPKRDWRFGRARAFVAVGQPISTSGYGLDRLEELKAIARARIEALLREIRPLAS